MLEALDALELVGVEYGVDAQLLLALEVAQQLDGHGTAQQQEQVVDPHDQAQAGIAQVPGAVGGDDGAIDRSQTEHTVADLGDPLGLVALVREEVGHGAGGAVALVQNGGEGEEEQRNGHELGAEGQQGAYSGLHPGPCR